MKRYLSIFIKAALVAAALTYVFWDMNTRILFETISRFRPWALALALAYTFYQYACISIRFRYLAGNELSFWLSARAIVLGLGVNNMVPAKLGEFAKALYIRKETNISLGKILTTVFWERFADINALLVLSLAVMFTMRSRGAALPLIGVVLCIWLLIFIIARMPTVAEKLFELLPFERLRLMAMEMGMQIRSSARPSYLGGAAAYTLLTWSAHVGFMHLAINILSGLNFSFAQVLTVFVVSTLGMAVPSSPGALGVFEASMALSLSWFGVGKEEALATGLVVRFFQFVPSTLCALVLLGRSGLRLSTIIKRSEEGL